MMPVPAISPSSERPRYAVGRNEQNAVAIEAAASRSGPPCRGLRQKCRIGIIARMPLGSIADAELDAEINAEANKEHSECDRDQVQRSYHPKPIAAVRTVRRRD